MACCPETCRRPRQLLSYAARFGLRKQELSISSLGFTTQGIRREGPLQTANASFLRDVGVCAGKIETWVLESRETKRGDGMRDGLRKIKKVKYKGKGEWRGQDGDMLRPGTSC